MMGLSYGTRRLASADTGIHADHLQVEVTTRCNLRCIFCVGRHMDELDLSMDTFARAISLFDHLSHVELQGEGEPLLHPQFFTMARIIRERFPKCRLSFITNGTRFSGTAIEGILRGRFDSIFISLETTEDEKYRWIRKNSIHPVLEGVKKLIHAKKNRHREFPKIGFAVTVLKSTVLDLPGIASAYHQLQMDGGLMIQPLQTMDGYAQHYSWETRNQLLSAEMCRLLGSIVRTHHSVQQALSHVPPAFFRDLYAAGRRNNGCPWLTRGIYLDVKGNFLPCCFLKNQEKFSLGNINRIQTQVVNAMRERAHRAILNGNFPKACMKCRTLSRVAEHHKHLLLRRAIYGNQGDSRFGRARTSTDEHGLTRTRKIKHGR
ncbi:MAG: radical SAM/SPASM domain-containing protein [Desulfovibrionales bacterium]